MAFDADPPHFPILDFHCREQTYGKGYARAHEKARRSYYKFVCKLGCYGKLYLRHNKWGDAEHARGRPPFTYGSDWRHNYPVYDAPRSYVRERWGLVFKEHHRAAERALNAYYRNLVDGKFRHRALAAAQRSPLFKLATATHAIHHLASRCPGLETEALRHPADTGGRSMD